MVYHFFLFNFVFEHLFQKIKSKVTKSTPLHIYPFLEAELLGRLLYYRFIKKNLAIFSVCFCRLVRIGTIFSHTFDCSVSSDFVP